MAEVDLNKVLTDLQAVTQNQRNLRTSWPAFSVQIQKFMKEGNAQLVNGLENLKKQMAAAITSIETDFTTVQTELDKGNAETTVQQVFLIVQAFKEERDKMIAQITELSIKLSEAEKHKPVIEDLHTQLQAEKTAHQNLKDEVQSNPDYEPVRQKRIKDAEEAVRQAQTHLENVKGSK